MKNNYVIKSTNKKTNEVSYYLTGIECANSLGCTKQLVYQVLSKKESYKQFKSAKGHLLEWVPMTDFVTEELLRRTAGLQEQSNEQN